MQPRYPIYLFAPTDDGHLLVAWSIDNVGREVEPWYAENYVGFDGDARPVQVVNDRNIVVVRVTGEPDLDGLRRAIREWANKYGVMLSGDDPLLIAARERFLLDRQAKRRIGLPKGAKVLLVAVLALMAFFAMAAIAAVIARNR